ncbi:excinuclease ABC subunit UvrA [Streptococcus mutans]|jgi:Excinuclease ABC subunit A|uniref:UvrABC system protein A n=1 Tax=Streptococcus mutans serotype c (strain ATCC 700610 / UA159) TaxID=210007 RepID=UVRA_STRMU|nr:excinuclease ABC subunit UvrA [Streptococcus mutans]P72481.2 RecName: Full=UvrABC system protein A; Short=UvrA protein; AltName: Full=Excinuclease ABC subunit A [Streptococcus mutans UA159]AAN59473.1 putative excinuclease ABC (subunit A) [Streptococcus mutans UA159]AJD56078.1 excinuclease ABC subunit A [Streptococcus mutans UA159-FR]EMB60053.1 excinuclease ABC subunit A [Streptococcus mutans 8ID3]EMC61806.1 excinuclease ABC subunit A [Streptococcus mutans U2B]EMP59237.1 excinuclease ABC su
MQDKLIIRGARAHNLKNIDVEIPRDKLIVMTGLSGSGKSSLAFDTIYAEGQRRYVESLSAYARQFLGNMDKPDVDSIDGLSPAISIDQKTTSKNPRSTVGTVTEINDYLRLLYARVGIPYCKNGHGAITASSVEQIVDQVLILPERTRMQILAPVVRRKKGQHKAVFDRIQKDGYVRVRIDGDIMDVAEVPELSKNKMHNIEVVVDRLVQKDGIRGRLFDSIEAALHLGDGYVIIDTMDDHELIFSEHYSCPVCGFTVPELEPRLFSFNAPFGSCPTCDGLGIKLEVDLDLVIPDENKTLREGTLAPWNPISSNYYPQLLEQAMNAFGVDMDKPWKDLSDEDKKLVLHGSGDTAFHFHYQNDFGGVRDIDIPFEGIISNISRRYHETNSDFTRNVMRSYMNELPCATCHGYRLNDQALSVRVGGKEGLNIGQVSELSIADHLSLLTHLELSENEKTIATPIVKEIKDRLTFLNNVGLNYLTLSRSAGTLSGGESQRIRLATQIGSNLSGVLYILDEPSIGLHQRDNDRLISSLKKMRDLGNTLIVVEHDEDTMMAADWLVDVGPGAGALGGEIVASGTPRQVAKNKKSITGQYLSGKKKIPVPLDRRKGSGRFIEIKGAAENNLQNINVKFPLGKFIAVTGVSGSGKSTLVNSILKKVIAQKLNRNSEKPGKYKSISGIEHIDRLIDIDQSPIGRTPRSNPATYTGVFDDIRDLFAQTNEAKIRGYKKGRFSFNVKGGRCEACSGDGIIKIEMHFLPDVYVPCEVCHGTRYNSETLEVHYKDKNIAEILNMTVNDAAEFFAPIPKIARKIRTIKDVGLGYVTLGQPATTLSGGEAQRMKLASELHKRSTGKSFYILDEPTTGLHTDDIARLLKVLERFVDDGNTVLVIEHNLDVIKTADHIIDLGPEGGVGGGQVIATGTPEQVAEMTESYTGQYLKGRLNEK